MYCSGIKTFSCLCLFYNILQTVNGLQSNDLFFNDLENPPVPSSDECMGIQTLERFNCYPEGETTKEDCQNRGCCWIEPEEENSVYLTGTVPVCFYPANYGEVSFVNITDSQFGKTAYAQRRYYSPYPNDITIFRLDFKFESKQRLHVKIYDPNNKRFEPPIPEVPSVDVAATDTDYDIVLDELKFGFQVVRKSNNDVLFNTQNVGAFIFADQYLQLSAALPSKFIYGLGEHRSPLLLSTDWQMYTIYNHDQNPLDNTNLYGSHPFYMMMENSGNSHGVFLLNSNAMDVFLQPTPAITFTTIGGILDFYFFLGPTPDDVVSQYTEVIGRPYLPPYWGLGYHQCKYGYGSLNNTMAAWSRTRDAGIPFDVQWNDIDYMHDQNDFTFDTENFTGLPDFVKELHSIGMHWVPIIDPGVSGSEPAGTYPPYDRGVELGTFIKNSSGEPFVGKVWNPVSTVWPDFTHPNVTQYWFEMLQSMHELVQFDGIWIDMNEPSNFVSGSIDGCENTTLEYPPYVPHINGGKMFYRTVCMEAEHYAGKHYNIHNLYGLSEAIATNKVLTELRGTRAFIITRSSFPGLGHYAGHWSGDIHSNWGDMVRSIPEILSFSMFGVPLMGADICGFGGNTAEQLCERWMELGAFYPFARNHNNLGNEDQDPAAVSLAVAEASRKVLLIRYSLLPYLYTLFIGAHVNGTTVAKPLFFEFPLDDQTYNIDYEFLWGKGLLIIPVLEWGRTEVSAYVPKAQWYDYYTGELVSSGEENITLSAPLDTIPLLLRGGTILPTQVPGMTTTESRENNFGLLVAADENGTATGSLYWDDGDTIGTYENEVYNWIDFSLKVTEITGTPLHTGYQKTMILGNIMVVGMTTEVKTVTVNDVDTPFSYDAFFKVLKIENLNVSLTNSFIIKLLSEKS